MLRTSKDTCEILGVHPNTLRRYAKEGKIKHEVLPSGQRRYDVESFINPNVLSNYEVVYCRVSSHKQTDDLYRQVCMMKELYPSAEVITDVGSGINYNRKGVKTILERLLRGDQFTLVVAHRDRLARFGTELIEFLIKSNGGELMVLNEDLSKPEQKLTEDLLSILHVFSCRMHGSRKYKKD